MSTANPVVERLDESLPFVGAALAYLVAAIHLFHQQYGFPRLVELAVTGNLDLLVSDPRPLVFVLTGFAIVLGPKLVLYDVARKRVYLGGMALMAAFFLGYFAWHMTGHGAFLPGRPAQPSGLGPVAEVLSHLVDNPLVRLSKIAELLLFAILVVLYRRADDGERSTE